VDIQEHQYYDAHCKVVPTGGMDVCCECCVLSGRGLCDGLITRPEESCRLWRVVVCEQETSKTRKLKPATGLWKIQPQWVVTTGKQTNKQQNCKIVHWNGHGMTHMRFSAPVQTCPGSQPASYAMDTESFAGVNRPGRGVDHPPSYYAEVKKRVELYICSPLGLRGLL